jgi:DNA-binding CsgD family transcriptional regulator
LVALSETDLRELEALIRAWLAERMEGAEPTETGSVELLTEREREVLRWVARGGTNTEIAAELSISSGTVRKHLEHAYAKLGVSTRTAAVAAVFSLLPLGY